MCTGAEIAGAAAVISAVVGGASAVSSMTAAKPGTPKLEAAPAAPAPIDKPDAEKVQNAADAERRRLLSRSGRSSTIATSGLGVAGTAPTTMRTLLGGL